MWTLVILQESFLYQKHKMQIKLNLKDYCFLKNRYKTIFLLSFLLFRDSEKFKYYLTYRNFFLYENNLGIH